MQDRVARMNMFHRARRVGVMLRNIGFSLCTCESCTGGMLSSVLTSVPGSSDYFLGGVIAYANAVKVRLVGVRTAVLKQHGAVSSAAARGMARGVRQRFGSDVAVSITGIAGPSGGTREKPVGRVYLCVVTGHRTVVKSHLFRGTRRIIREKACRSALHLLETTLARIPARTRKKN